MRVCVVGGGIAGLYACHYLKKLNIDFVLVESSDRLGGRMLQKEVSGINVEVGAEFIHGENSILNHLLKKLNLKYKPTFDWTSAEAIEFLGYFFNGKLHLTNDVQEIIEIFEEKLPKFQEEKNITLLEFMKKENLSEDLMKIADCFYGKTNNTNVKYMGTNESARQERLWPYSGQNFKLKESWKPLLDYLSKDLNPIYNFKVTKISYPKNRQIVVHGENVKKIRCDKVLLTVPLPILKDIKFIPQLPVKKQFAITHLGFGKAMKTIITFKKKFWKKMNLIFTDDPCINQIWMMNQTDDEFFVTGFTVAESVDNFNKIKDPAKYFVDLLDKIFNNEASPCFKQFVGRFDWTTNESIKGGYSFNKFNSYGCNNDLFENIDERVFFAGEATSMDSIATITGALESSERALHQIIKIKSKI
eukprot:gene1548-12674_t